MGMGIDNIGERISKSLGKAIEATSLEQATKDVLAACLKRLDDVIEHICPIAAAHGLGGYRLVTAYGPGPGFKSSERVVIIVTAKDHVVFALDDWYTNKEAIEHLRENPHADAMLWHLMAVAMRENDFETAAKMFSLKCVFRGQHTALDDGCSEVRKHGCMPVIVALVADRGDRAGGIVSVEALPLPIDEQFNLAEALDFSCP